jgi:hypothetical protein
MIARILAALRACRLVLAGFAATAIFMSAALAACGD